MGLPTKPCRGNGSAFDRIRKQFVLAVPALMVGLGTNETRQVIGEFEVTYMLSGIGALWSARRRSGH